MAKKDTIVKEWWQSWTVWIGGVQALVLFLSEIQKLLPSKEAFMIAGVLGVVQIVQRLLNLAALRVKLGGDWQPLDDDPKGH